MVKLRKTFSQKPVDINRKWVLLDASEMTLGRLSTAITKYLIGKYKPTYTPHVDNGDYVVVINADKLVVTGEKETEKMYYRHSGYMGGLTELTLAEVRAKDSTLIIEHAVKGMIPANRLTDGRMARLKIFTGSEHAHTAQSPVKVEVK